MMHSKVGAPIISQYIEMNYNRIPRAKYRLPLDPGALGIAAYVFYQPQSDESPNIIYSLKGVCTNITLIEKDHPILKGYHNDTLYIRSWATGSFVNIPDNVAVLANYPIDIMENDSKQQIHAWNFNLFKFSDVILLREYFNLRLKGIGRIQAFIESVCYLPNWNKTDEIIQTEMPGNAAIIAFQNGDGRVVLSGPHPSNSIWKDAEIDENPKTSGVSINDGFYRWKKDDTWLTQDDTIKNYALWWYQRREAAWVSGQVENDSHLPPVYNRSQVVDINPKIQNPNFTIECIVGKEKDEIWTTLNLTLYYRYYNKTNSCWTNWTDYNSINGAPYYFIFNSDEIQGDGKYEFYTILNTTYENNYTCDDAPPEADTYAIVGGPIYADFTYTPQYPYTSTPITFDSSNSETRQGTHINIYNWQFGDGNDSWSANPTHTYTENGIYNVTLSITNNQSETDNITKTITIHNIRPNAEFDIPCIFAFINETINFTSQSTDVDGSITDWYYDFGDGTYSSEENPIHHFSSSGFYTITLEVTDDDGATNKTSESIIITDILVNQSKNIGNNTWKKIQDALDNSTNGDFIYVKNGVYSENITINKSITLVGEDKINTIIKGTINMVDPLDFELTNNYSSFPNIIINMTGNTFLMHLNNDSTVGENYDISDIVYDYSGNNNNGVLYGCSWSTNTFKGAGCLLFDGINNQINLSNSTLLSSENLTISVWINWDNGTGTIDPIIAQTYNNQGYKLFINSTNGYPAFQLDDTIIDSNYAIGSGWHHILGTHNETTLKIYINGILMGNASVSGSGVDAFGFIGFDNNSNFFSGRIDEMAVWNRSLSDDEIKLVYNGNYGIYIEGFTIKDSGAGVVMCNHSEIFYCDIINQSVGVILNNSEDIGIFMCNFSNVGTGISIFNSNPESLYYNNIVECYIDGATNGIVVNYSSNLSIIRSLINGSNLNLSITSCEYETILVSDCTTPNNVAPDIPCLVGPDKGDINTDYYFITSASDSNNDQVMYKYDWGDGSSTGWIGLYQSNQNINISHSWTNQGGYFVRVKAKDIFGNESGWATPILFKTETLPPLIDNVTNNPDIVGFGEDITITVNVVDDTVGNYSGIKYVNVNITYPDDTSYNYSMDAISRDTYRYVFHNTWLSGQYDYTIWAVDNAYNVNSSSGHSFSVSAEATITIATLKDVYTNDEFINITDPPNPPEDYLLVNRGLTWDEYYNEVTSENILEIATGPINYQDENNTWTAINCTIHQLKNTHPAYSYGYRAGNEHGLYNVYFKPNIQNNWPVAFAYNKSNDPVNSVIRTKLLGVGYLDPTLNWTYHYLQKVQSSQGQLNDDKIVYEDVFTGTDVIWCYKNTELKEEFILNNMTKISLQNHPPSEYGLNDESSYLVFITKIEFRNLNMYNYSGVLTGNVTVEDGQIDFKDEVGHLKCTLPLGEVYELYNDSSRQKLTYRIIQYNGNTYLLAGLKVSDLSNMTFPVVIDPSFNIFNVYSTASDGCIYRYSSVSYNTAWVSDTGIISASADYITLGQNKGLSLPNPTYYIYRGFLFFNTSALPSNAYITDAILSLYKKADNSFTDFTIIVQDGQPTYPHDPLQTGDYNKNHYSGVGGVLNTTNFVNGRNNIVLTNYSWIMKQGMTKFCLRSDRDINGTIPSGNEYVDVYSNEKGVFYAPKLQIIYRNQSKIKNTGGTNISGYLLMQVQYYNETIEDWVLVSDTVNETSPRIINTGEQLALDLIFNGLVNTNGLCFGDGLYRVFACFRSPGGNVLVCDDESLLEASYEFTIKYT
jgi:hypothetical protein